MLQLDELFALIRTLTHALTQGLADSGLDPHWAEVAALTASGLTLLGVAWTAWKAGKGAGKLTVLAGTGAYHGGRLCWRGVRAICPSQNLSDIDKAVLAALAGPEVQLEGDTLKAKTCRVGIMADNRLYPALVWNGDGENVTDHLTAQGRKAVLRAALARKQAILDARDAAEKARVLEGLCGESQGHVSLASRPDSVKKN